MTTKGLRTWKIPRFEANDGVVLLINGTAKVDVIENCFSKNGRTQVIEFQSAVGKPVKAKIVPCCAVWCSLGRVILWTPMIWNIFLGWGESQAIFPKSRKDSCFNWWIFVRCLKFETPIFSVVIFVGWIWDAPKKCQARRNPNGMVGCVGTTMLQQVLATHRFFGIFTLKVWGNDLLNLTWAYFFRLGWLKPPTRLGVHGF